MNIQHYLDEKATLIEQHLDALILDHTLPPTLADSSRYALLGGGKRIRPILALATAEVLGSDPKTFLTPACALELIHTYSLIHDDLPCMDNDDFRRGKPTVHKRYNEGHAVLTGDYLLTYAFELLATSPGLAAEQKLHLVQILAQKSGGAGMVAGQVMDIEGEKQTMNLPQLREIHHKKTGALISAAVEFGAICAQANTIQMHTLKDYAREIGIAFQITDDILDVTSGAEKRGPQQASDQKNGKSTYVSLMGLEGSKKTAEQHVKAAIHALKHLNRPAQPLEEIAELLLHRTK